MSLPADFYDGLCARRHCVALYYENGFLRVQGEGVERLVALADVRLSEPMGAAPRLLTFSDGAFCEIRDHAGLQRLLDESGQRDSWVVRGQSGMRWRLAASALCMAFVLAGYRWGLPWVSARIADALPVAVSETVSERVLSLLDARYLSPSRLPASRQAAIARRFAALHVPEASLPGFRLVFRAGRAMPANALALPSGVIILTDDLVMLSRSDSELLAVLAHEAAHVQLRHGMRQVVQSTLVGVLAAWFFGDVSSIVAAAPAALLDAKYSRDAERDADRYAVRLLEANGISPRCLADVLQRLERAAGPGEDAGISGYLATHPAIQQRVDVITGGVCE